MMYEGPDASESHPRSATVLSYVGDHSLGQHPAELRSALERGAAYNSTGVFLPPVSSAPAHRAVRRSCSLHIPFGHCALLYSTVVAGEVR